MKAPSPKGQRMGKVVASITTSVDGYIAGRDDGPGCGLGVGGERLHFWVFGGPWSYEAAERGQPTGEDKLWLEQVLGGNGAVVAGRGTYEAAGHWGDRNPWDTPAFVVTHRPEEQPPGGEFVFVGGLVEAVEQARRAAGDKDVHVMGGAAHPSGLGRRHGRAFHLDRGPCGARCRQEAVRGIRSIPGARPAWCAPVALCHLHRVRSAADGVELNDV